MLVMVGVQASNPMWVYFSPPIFSPGVSSKDISIVSLLINMTDFVCLVRTLYDLETRPISTNILQCDMIELWNRLASKTSKL